MASWHAGTVLVCTLFPKFEQAIRVNELLQPPVKRRNVAFLPTLARVVIPLSEAMALTWDFYFGTALNNKHTLETANVSKGS